MGSPENGHSSRSAWFQEAFGKHSQAQGGIFGVSCSRPGVGFNDPGGSLPIQDILYFFDNVFLQPAPHAPVFT